jgi:sugar phosphate isomerase/epimerase
MKTIVWGSSGARMRPEGTSLGQAMEQFVKALKSVAPIAQENGITLAIEPLNPDECNFINHLDEGARAVEACGHPAVRLLCDFYHMNKSGDGAEAILKNGKFLHHAHVSELSPKRNVPGTEGDDFRPLLKALKSCDYKGGISMECSWDSFEGQSRHAVQAMQGQLKDSGF